MHESNVDRILYVTEQHILKERNGQGAKSVEKIQHFANWSPCRLQNKRTMVTAD